MICGSPQMLADFRRILLDGRGFDRGAAHRQVAPGHYVFERAFVEKFSGLSVGA
jgi:ferredoxin/flavodoxin---NADP+ reductase